MKKIILLLIVGVVLITGCEEYDRYPLKGFTFQKISISTASVVDMEIFVDAMSEALLNNGATFDNAGEHFIFTVYRNNDKNTMIGSLKSEQYQAISEVRVWIDATTIKLAEKLAFDLVYDITKQYKARNAKNDKKEDKKDKINFEF